MAEDRLRVQEAKANNPVAAMISVGLEDAERKFIAMKTAEAKRCCPLLCGVFACMLIRVVHVDMSVYLFDWLLIGMADHHIQCFFPAPLPFPCDSFHANESHHTLPYVPHCLSLGSFMNHIQQ